MRKVFAFSYWYLVCALAFVSAQSKPSPTGYSVIQANNWSFQCMYDSTCGVNGSGGASWITTRSQPGTVRLWNAGVAWYNLETSSGTFDWNGLDLWLDLIAQHEPMTVIYTFGDTPCWISSVQCSGNGWAGERSPSPPKDLASGGSPSFNEFVRQLTLHCSPNGNCVNKYINIFEMWNEANLPAYWTGTPTQLYDMFKPVAPIIHANAPDALISTPPVVSGDTTWMGEWLSLENTNGKLSNIYGFHVYMDGFLPEKRINMVGRMLTTKNDNGWTNVPWMNTETNFQAYVFSCPTTYTAEECDGMLVRWFVLQFAYDGGPGGAASVGWFDWPSITAGDYDTYFYTMMQWLEGGIFSQSCTSSEAVYTCSFTEASGKSALIVWNAEQSSTYTPATQYVDYQEFNGTYGGAKVTISPGQATTIGVIPIMFETK